jgi:hypothetical protein
MNKQNVLAYPNSGILFTYENELLAHAYIYKLYELWKFYATLKKPETKGHIIWFYLYETPKISKSTDIELRLVVGRV